MRYYKWLQYSGTGEEIETKLIKSWDEHKTVLMFTGIGLKLHMKLYTEAGGRFGCERESKACLVIYCTSE